MGELAGRLMAALSMLADLEDSYGWDEQPAQARDTVRFSRLLVASVLRIVIAGEAEREDEAGMVDAVDATLRRLLDGHNGGRG